MILDEPTFGQDRRTWVELVELLAELRDEGRAIVAATHDGAFVAALADRVVTLPATQPASLPTALPTASPLGPVPTPNSGRS